LKKRSLKSLCSFLLSTALCLVSSPSSAQNNLSIHAPGDTTLHGNPNCVYWLRLDPKVKDTWLKAILSPLNMGYMYRQKPPVDRYQALPSLGGAIKFVDNYCTENGSAVAMTGALGYFEKLISQPQENAAMKP
jgi:predicted outer membrane repeat protein